MLEICCGSYYDGVQAAKGGAGRIELNSGLHLGGLTPSLGTLELVKETCDVKVIAMVRPRGGGFCYCKEDFEVMKRDAGLMLAHGAEGIAFGCLTLDAAVNREQNEAMISIIHDLGGEAVFHRAFDCTVDPWKSMEMLIELGVDRVLTSGLKPKAPEGRALLKELQAAYGDRIEILAGSGINASNAAGFMKETGITQLHSSCKDWIADPTTEVNGVSFAYGTPPRTGAYDVVSRELVRELLECMGEG